LSQAGLWDKSLFEKDLGSFENPLLVLGTKIAAKCLEFSRGRPLADKTFGALTSTKKGAEKQSGKEENPMKIICP
jgi:hypothetical protein